MDFFLIRGAQIDFFETFPPGISGKFGKVLVDLRQGKNTEEAMIYFKSLKSWIQDYQAEVFMTVRVIVKDEPKGEGILQLQLDDTVNFLRDMCVLPGLENLTVKVRLFEVKKQSTGEVTPPEIFMLSKEMKVLLEDCEKTCQDYHFQLPEGWTEMFQKREEKLTAGITVGVIINSKSTPGGNSIQLYKKMWENDSYKDVTLVVRNDYRVKCHKSLLAACSPKFAAMFQSDMKKEEVESQILKIPDLTEEGVTAFLEYLYFQGKDKPLEKCEIAFELLHVSHKYEMTGSDMEASMKQIFFSKPADWFEVDVILKLFQLAKILPCGDELKKKAAHVLKKNAKKFKLTDTCWVMFQKNTEASAELMKLVMDPTLE